MNLSLFPKNEEWGTGDEALDGRLSAALKKAAENLSLKTISDFYIFGVSLKPRAYNPALSVTIELVTKALLYNFDPFSANDLLLKKLKGHYEHKIKKRFHLRDVELITNELKKNHKYRYQNQIDFSFTPQVEVERNPFIQYELIKSPFDMTAKIIFKEFKFFLNGENTKENYHDDLFVELKLGESILLIENFAEIWYDNDQIFSLNLIS